MTDDANAVNGKNGTAAKDRAFRERPAFNFRFQLILGFFTFFIISVVVSVAAMIALDQIKEKINTIRTWEQFLFNVEQARRWEKNFFLYGTNLDDALASTQAAKTILDDNLKKFEGSEIPAKKQSIKRHLDLYRGSLLQLRELAMENAMRIQRAEENESELRRYGAKIVSEAEELTAREHDLVFRWLQLVEKIPAYYLVFLFFLMIYMIRLFSRRFMRPLNYLVNETERIAGGDFTPVKPYRRYRDEFTTVKNGINRMLQELENRQNSLIEAHKLRAVGILTAGVAHEINNPINNIMLTACSLQDEYDDLTKSEQLDMINDIVTETERSRGIVQNLLDFTREKTSPDESIDLGILVEETINLAKNQAKVQGIPIKLDVQEGLPPVMGDLQELKQVFLNLVMNALDAVGKDGLIQVRVRSYKQNYLSVQVEDNGSGIDPDSLPYIFDPFYTTKAVGKGTGLGLSVSRGIVNKHGGRIEAHSEPGQYTRFTVILPPYPGSATR